MLGNHQHWQSSIDNPMNPMNFGWGGTASNFLISVAPKCPSLSGRVCVSDVPELPMIFVDVFEDRMEDGHKRNWQNWKKQGQVSAWWTYHFTTDFHSPRAWAGDFRNHVTGASTKKHAKTRHSKSRVPIFEALGSAQKIPSGSWNSVPVSACFFLVHFPADVIYPSKKNDPYNLLVAPFGAAKNFSFWRAPKKNHRPPCGEVYLDHDFSRVQNLHQWSARLEWGGQNFGRAAVQSAGGGVFRSFFFGGGNKGTWFVGFGPGVM